MSRLKTLMKTTAMTITATAVLATSAGLAANALPPESKDSALEEVGQGYHLQIDDNLVWFGGLKNPDGHDPLIWSTIFTNKIPYDSQGYFLNTTNVDNHQDPQLSVTGTQMGWILATYESVNTTQSRAAISLLNRLNFDASAYALDPSHDPNSELLRPARERAAKATAAMQQEHPDVVELAKKYANQAVNASPEKFGSPTVQGDGTSEGTINLRWINALGKPCQGLKATATLDGPAVFKDSGTKTWQGESTSEGFQIPWKSTGVGTVKAEIEIMTGYYSLVIQLNRKGLTSVRTGPGKNTSEATRKQAIEFNTAEPEPAPSPEPEPTPEPAPTPQPLAQTGANLAPLGVATLLAAGGAAALVAKRRKN